jgi:hypothetical protein
VGGSLDVTVNVGMGVNVREGRGVNTLVAGRLVDVSTGMAEGEAVGFSFVELQALVIMITKMRTYELLFLIFLFY